MKGDDNKWIVMVMAREKITGNSLHHKTGINREHISLMLKGRLKLLPEEEEKVAQTLNCKREELFN